jgi:hypothetical protein
MSADAKHTPGPWMANRSTVFGPDDANGHVTHVAVLAHGQTLDANARLIAAAPELLDALQDAMEALAMCQPRTDHGARWQSAAMQKARVTIAKAKGELA